MWLETPVDIGAFFIDMTACFATPRISFLIVAAENCGADWCCVHLSCGNGGPSAQLTSGRAQKKLSLVL